MLNVTQGATYQPSADDIGARICVQAGIRHTVQREDDVPFSIYGEVGPLRIDPSVESEYSGHISEGKAIFYGLEDQHVPTQLYTLELCRDVVALYMVDLAAQGDTPHDPEDIGKLVARGPWSSDTKIILDSSGTALLAIQLPKMVEENEPLALLVRSLVAPNRERRDVIALTWRQFRQLRLKGEVVKDHLEVTFHKAEDSPRTNSPLASIASVFSKGRCIWSVTIEHSSLHTSCLTKVLW